MVVGRFAVGQKPLVARVGTEQLARVFDGAEILLGPCDDFGRVADQSVGVGAVGAVKTLEHVEVGQVLAINGDVVGAPYLGNFVDRSWPGKT